VECPVERFFLTSFTSVVLDPASGSACCSDVGPLQSAPVLPRPHPNLRGGRMGPVTERTTNTTQVVLHTTEGDIRLTLFPTQAPKTVSNFVGLAEGSKDYSQRNARGELSGPFYDGSLFHRVIAGFMIQGGDPTGTGRGGPGYRFGDETHPDLQFNRPYLLAMANAGPNTNGSQFFITVGPATHLNRKHTIFGEVTDQESRSVVDAIARTPTRGDRPVDNVVIERVTVEPAGM
jgi:peptidyl-prolyl cis-trans isomerase A (cyclophilin A)